MFYQSISIALTGLFFSMCSFYVFICINELLYPIDRANYTNVFYFFNHSFVLMVCTYSCAKKLTPTFYIDYPQTIVINKKNIKNDKFLSNNFSFTLQNSHNFLGIWLPQKRSWYFRIHSRRCFRPTNVGWNLYERTCR